jgi:Kef-type K+ transport system membrane component KefB
VAERLGIHAALGAFFLGVALSKQFDEANQAREVIYQFAVSFFAPLYFVSVGLRVNFVEGFDLVLVAVVLGVACLGKLAGASLGAWLGGMPPRRSLAVGFAMNARGAMELILATIALQAGLIDQRIFVALVFMAIVTSLMSGPAMKRLVGGRIEGSS